MKTKTGFNIREVCGEKIIVPEGKGNIDFSNIISMNESAAYLWNNIQGKDFTIDDLASILLEEYDVDRHTAETDASALVSQWAKAGIIEGYDIPPIQSALSEEANPEKESSTTIPIQEQISKHEPAGTTGNRK